MVAPDIGDIIWLQFTPQQGHEQSGKCPALVLSPKLYNDKTSLAICCPITTKIKGYPFEVGVKGKKIDGVVLADQVKSLDWRARGATFAEKAAAAVTNDVKILLKTLLAL